MRVFILFCFMTLGGIWVAGEPVIPAAEVPGRDAEQYALSIVQYEVSAKPCAAENAMMETIVKKAGYACAVPKGRLVVNLKMGEPIKVTDFMNRQITVAVEGKKDNYLLVRVKIPGEMDAVFMPVIGGSFVAGYDLDAKKTRGVLLLIYAV